MRYTIVVIVSCYIGLTYEFIAPKGAAENHGIRSQDVFNTTYNASNVNQSTVLHRINTSFTTHLKMSDKNDLDKALLADPQAKNSEINERAFIYIKSVKPVQNHLFNTYTDNDPNSHVLHESEVFEDVARKFFDGYMKNGFFKVKGTDETINLKSSNLTHNNPHKKPNENRRDEYYQEKRDYFELLKVPLLRSLSNSNDVLKNLRLKTNSLPYYATTTRKVDEIDFDDDEINKQVDRFIEQIISRSLVKPTNINNNAVHKDCDDCINQVQIHALCQCKSHVKEMAKQ